MDKEFHCPVLLESVLHCFGDCDCCIFVDATVGAGGHAEAILQAHPEITRYIGFDQDEEALRIAKKRLEPWKDRVELVHANFVDMKEELEQRGINKVDAMLFDIGVSSMHLDDKERGFSFLQEGPLDMRMNRKKTDLTAKDILNSWSKEKLEKIFWEYGEERKSRRCAKVIVETRKKRSIDTTKDLVDVLMPVLGRGGKRHPLTKVFQALRICVNDELNVLSETLSEATTVVKEKGKLVVITFHSLEDRIVKGEQKKILQKKKSLYGLKKLKRILIKPSFEEIRKNPRSRSAKLRVMEM